MKKALLAVDKDMSLSTALIRWAALAHRLKFLKVEYSQCFAKALDKVYPDGVRIAPELAGYDMPALLTYVYNLIPADFSVVDEPATLRFLSLREGPCLSLVATCPMSHPRVDDLGFVELGVTALPEKLLAQDGHKPNTACFVIRGHSDMSVQLVEELKLEHRLVSGIADACIEEEFGKEIPGGNGAIAESSASPAFKALLSKYKHND